MGLVGRILLIAGLGATIVGAFDIMFLWRGTPEPEAVTLESLGRPDGTRNVHLTLSGYTFGEQLLVEQDDDGRWRRVWIPLLTPEGEWTERPVVAHTNAVSSQAEVEALARRGSLTGVVTNGRQSLGANQREQFALAYPGVDLDGAIAFEIDRRFPSPLLAYPLTIGGLVFLALGVGLSFGLIGRGDSEAALSMARPNPPPPDDGSA